MVPCNYRTSTVIQKGACGPNEQNDEGLFARIMSDDASRPLHPGLNTPIMYNLMTTSRRTIWLLCICMALSAICGHDGVFAASLRAPALSSAGLTHHSCCGSTPAGCACPHAQTSKRHHASANAICMAAECPCTMAPPRNAAPLPAQSLNRWIPLSATVEQAQAIDCAPTQQPTVTNHPPLDTVTVISSSSPPRAPPLQG